MASLLERSAVFALVTTGCITLGPAFAPGERLSVAREAVLADVPGAGGAQFGEVEPSLPPCAAAEKVLPRGAIVEVSGDLEERRENMRPGALWQDQHPSFHVRVVASPSAAQLGWEGWVFVEALARAPISPLEFDEALLKAARLCPTRETDRSSCWLALPVGTPVRVIECQGAQARVEAWVDGLRHCGWVLESQLKSRGRPFLKQETAP